MEYKFDSSTNDYIIMQETTDYNRKRKNWDMAIGLHKIDNITPSEYLLKLAEDNINGKLEISEVEPLLKAYYENRDLSIKEEAEKSECDLVSARITELLAYDAFSFRTIALKGIHSYLFKDLYDFAGEYRTHNITKEEFILNNNTVSYANYDEIEKILEYDFNKEKEASYKSASKKEEIERLVKFTSSIWQAHPFADGNTRTVAVFIEQYLRNMRYKVTNDYFKEHSVYFRNALVRSNYSNIEKNIRPTNEYLIRFFENLLAGAKHQLNNRDLIVKELFDN